MIVLASQLVEYSFLICVMITRMAMMLLLMVSVQALRRAGVKFFVAPYEADAQLAFLNRFRSVDVVITEDSDCLPYGCRKVRYVWERLLEQNHGLS